MLPQSSQDSKGAPNTNQSMALKEHSIIEDSSVHLHPPAILLTERLSIRQATEADVPIIHSFLCNEEAMKHMATATSTSLDDTKAWFSKRSGIVSLTGERQGEFFHIISLRNDDGEVQAIGTIGMRRIPYLGYQIGAGPQFWGKGYGSEAVSAVLQGISENLRDEHPSYAKTAYVAIEVESDNVGSLKVAQKVGAVEVGQRIEETNGKVIKEFRYYVSGQEEI